MKSILKKVVLTFTAIAASLSVLLGSAYVFAAPTAAPNGSVGVPLPLNVGPTAQTKAGNLTIGGALTVTGNATINGTLNLGVLCLAGDCKSSWPSSGSLGVGNVTGGAYWNSSCYGYSYYTQLQYWSYNNSYNQYVYNCGQQNFSISFASNVPSGKTILSTSGSIWCHAGSGYYNSYGNPNTYISDSYYPGRTQGTVTSISNNNNGTVTVNFSCTLVNASGGNYLYGGFQPNNLTFFYQ